MIHKTERAATEPVIVLVGRPNVGKSTLFNYLTKTKQALVADYPGLTRDRQYLRAFYQQKPYWVVDTGGVGVEDAHIDHLMSQQSQVAWQEADYIFFMVDVKAGLTPLDQDIASRLRKLNKPVYVLVNKVDHHLHQLGSHEFNRLGFSHVYPISAAHGQGIAAILDDLFHTYVPAEDVSPSSPDEKVVAVIGRPNVGKSTLLNSLLGESRVVVSDVPGTTRDSIHEVFHHNGQQYRFIDTAGVRRRARVHEKIEKFSIVKTLQAIEEAESCMILMDAVDGILDQDLHLLGLVLEAGKALVVVVNKWDKATPDERRQCKQTLERRLRFVEFAPVCFISALKRTGIKTLLGTLKRVQDAAEQRFSTAKMTRLILALTQQHPPPLIKGRRVKIRYAHVGGHHPLCIVLHGQRLNELPGSYTRYLMNAIREALALEGVPIQFEYK